MTRRRVKVTSLLLWLLRQGGPPVGCRDLRDKDCVPGRRSLLFVSVFTGREVFVTVGVRL